MRISVGVVDVLAVAGGLAVIVGSVALHWALGIIAIGAGLLGAAVYLTRRG